MTSKTVVLLNPYGTDVTPFVNHTSGYAQLMSGSVGAVGDTVYTLPYNNNVSTSANITTGAGLLDTKLNATSGEVLVFGYSEGCQIADYWLTNYGPTTSVSTADVSFLLIGNANRKYGGFAYDRSVFNSIGYTGGKPDGTAFRCVDFCRQYDPIADFPTATAIVDALVGLSYVGSDANAYSGAMQAVANVMASTPYSTAVSNALCGLALIHTGLGVAGTGYMSVTVSDPDNLSLVDGNITWVWSPTYPVPLLGVGGTFPQSDLQLRTIIEQAYTRPVTIPMPDYGNNSGWGVEPFPLPVSPPPVTGWWAELHVAVAITVTPAISVSHGFIGGAVAIVVTPAVSGSSKTLVLASVIQMVTVTASASVILSRGATVTATPSVTPVAGLLSSMASSVTVTPSVSVAAEITTTASVSVAISATPSLSVAAVVTESASVATTVTPSVTVAAAVIEPASVAVSVTPSVSVAATINEPATASITVTPSVTVAAALGETAAVSVSVTPSVSVAASVSISGPTFDAVGPGGLNDSTFGGISWAHTAASGADLFVFIGTPTTNTAYWPTGVTYNGNAMTSIATDDGREGALLLYHLAHAGTGSSKNVAVTWGDNPFYANCNSISFNNVAGVGSPGYAQDSGSPSIPTQTATLALPGTLILQGFGFEEPDGSVTTSGGTADYSFYDSTSLTALTINHAASTQTFTGSTGSSCYWAGIDVALYAPLPVAITVTPTVSVSMSAPTVVGAVATTVTPTVTASAVVTRFATATPTVTPTVTAAATVTRFATVAESVTPTVTTAGAVILPVSVAITATPSIATATADDTSINVTVTPSISAAAVVTRIATVTETVTPTVTAAAVVTEFANVAATVTPAVTVAGASIANIASAVTATPAVSPTASTAVASAITVTPSVATATSDDTSIYVTVTPAVSAAAVVILPATVAITATPAVTPTAGTVYNVASTITATPAVTSAGVLGVVGAVAVTATPTVSVAATVSTAGATFDATAISAYQSSSSSFTLSLTAASGADVIVAVYAPTSSETVSSVKIGSTAFTSLGSVSPNASTSLGYCAVYRGAGAGTGSPLTITVTLSGGGFTGWATATSYTNVTGVGTLVTAHGNSTAPTASVSCSVNDVVWGSINNSTTRTYTAFSLTQRQYNHTSTDDPYFINGDTTAASTSVTVSATQSASAAWCVAALDIQ